MKNYRSRRTFIKTTSGAMLGAALLPESVFAQGSNFEQKIRCKINFKRWVFKGIKTPKNITKGVLK